MAPRRPALRAAPAAALAAVLGATAHGGDCGLEVLQWNIHGECFRNCSSRFDSHCDVAYPRCRKGATGFLKQVLENGKLDFAGVEQLEDAGFLMSGVSKDDWGQVQHRCGGDNGFGRWPFDIATVYFNRHKWEELSAPLRGGCMAKVMRSPRANYRAFVAQAFQRRGASSDRVIVAAVHYPHDMEGVGILAGALQGLQKETGVEKLLILADTNRGGRQSSASILHEVYPSSRSIVSTTLHHTCCFPRFDFFAPDRIIAADFPGAQGPIRTSLPFGHHSPRWAAKNMHDPVSGSLTYSCPKAPAQFV